jgi:hypothetical protein
VAFQHKDCALVGVLLTNKLLMIISQNILCWSKDTTKAGTILDGENEQKTNNGKTEPMIRIPDCKSGIAVEGGLLSA